MKIQIENLSLTSNENKFLITIEFECPLIMDKGNIFYQPKPLVDYSSIILMSVKDCGNEAYIEDKEFFVTNNLDDINERILSGDYDSQILESYEKEMEQIRKIQAILGVKPKTNKIKKSDIQTGRIQSSGNNVSKEHNWAPKGDISGLSTEEEPFLVIDESTGSIVGEFDNISNACKKLNLNYGHVLSCLRKERPRHEGYIFKYVSEDKNVNL